MQRSTGRRRSARLMNMCALCLGLELDPIGSDPMGPSRWRSNEEVDDVRPELDTPSLCAADATEGPALLVTSIDYYHQPNQGDNHRHY
ncbi:hypothetical protein N2382_09300 [SAR92 clade bacterium H921]|nr:hypothetical protein [SAR92 clade bacterium H921]